MGKRTSGGYGTSEKEQTKDQKIVMHWYNWLFVILMLLVHIPGMLWGYLWVLIMLPWACENPRFEFPALLTATWRKKVEGVWDYSTTISRGIIFEPQVRRTTTVEPLGRIERHERVHVHQSEDLTFLALLIGVVVGLCTGNWLLALCLWFSGPLWQLPFFVTALRYLQPAKKDSSWSKHVFVDTMYYKSEHELSARGQEDEGI